MQWNPHGQTQYILSSVILIYFFFQMEITELELICFECLGSKRSRTQILKLFFNILNCQKWKIMLTAILKRKRNQNCCHPQQWQRLREMSIDYSLVTFECFLFTIWPLFFFPHTVAPWDCCFIFVFLDCKHSPNWKCHYVPASEKENSKNQMFVRSF